MKINGRYIANGEQPYIVAEIGASHGNSLERAIMLMGAAIGAGADAVKFQCYTPDSITIDCDSKDFIIKNGPWKDRKLYELYQKAHTPREWFPDLFDIARRYNTTIFASVFSKEDVDFMEKLNCPAYKIASMEIVDLPLIGYVANTGKPVIISTGMASVEEITRACFTVKASNVALLHCVSGYPSDVSEANLSKINWLRENYNAPIGISDHSPGWEIPVAATALKASIIEKHIKLEDDNSSEDSHFALTISEFREMCKAVKSVWKGMLPNFASSEESTKQLRRSLYIVKNVKRGGKFTKNNVRSIRPGYGMEPRFLPAVLNSHAACDLERGTALRTEMVRWPSEH